MKFKDYITEAIPKSTEYALTGPDSIIIAKGSAKEMQKMRKEKGSGYRVWQTPGGKVGDKMK